MTQPTVFKPQEYIRRPLVVLAEEVTEENMADVAAWCRGEIRTAGPSEEEGRETEQKYIKVPVKRPLNQKQTQAYVGDWVLKAGSGFKVYTHKAFTSSFQKKVKDMLDTVERMIQREEREDREERERHENEVDDNTPMSGLSTSFVSP